MLNRLKDIYIRRQFDPAFLGLWINPFYFSRKGLYRHIRSLASHIHGRTLDVGCGQKPYEKLFQCTEYVGLELDSPANRKNKKATKTSSANK
jgi:hypothetical protein